MNLDRPTSCSSVPHLPNCLCPLASTLEVFLCAVTFPQNPQNPVLISVLVFIVPSGSLSVTTFSIASVIYVLPGHGRIVLYACYVCRAYALFTGRITSAKLSHYKSVSNKDHTVKDIPVWKINNEVVRWIKKQQSNI